MGVLPCLQNAVEVEFHVHLQRFENASAISRLEILNDPSVVIHGEIGRIVVIIVSREPLQRHRRRRLITTRSLSIRPSVPSPRRYNFPLS